jgi:hypothetical protein
MALREIADGLITHKDVDEQLAEDEVVLDEAIMDVDISPMEPNQ